MIVLSGVGMDVLVRHHDRRRVRRWAGAGFGVAGVVLVALWLVGRGHLPPAEAAIRNTSFVWPLVATAVGLVVVGILALVDRRTADDPRDGVSVTAVGRVAGISLLMVETAFLVASGAPLWTSSATPFAPSRAVVALKSAVGNSAVGFGAPLCFFPPGLGILPNAQLGYGVQELGLYDPLIPSTYFTSWTALTHTSAGNRRDFLYCPSVTTAAQARLYGVGFVLEPTGAKGPQGGVYDRTIGGEDLYRIPGAAPATLTPLPRAGVVPPADASGRPVEVTHPNPASWRLVTGAARTGMLRLRLTDVPGWHATIDGRSVPLSRFAGTMLQLEVPAGRHLVELNYWPSAFTLGLVLAGCAVVGLVGASTLSWVLRRRIHVVASTSSLTDGTKNP